MVSGWGASGPAVQEAIRRAASIPWLSNNSRRLIFHARAAHRYRNPGWKELMPRMQPSLTAHASAPCRLTRPTLRRLAVRRNISQD